MESGLEDRNNLLAWWREYEQVSVSMESGLEDRNNRHPSDARGFDHSSSQWSPA